MLRGSPIPASEATTARDPGRAPSLVRAVAVESSILIGLLLLGGLLLPRTSRTVIDPRLRVALALPVGIAAHATVGVLRLPGLWGAAATAAVILFLPTVLHARGTPSGWTRADVRALASASVGILAVVALARWTTFLMLTPDSRDYWAGGAVLADGNLAPALLDVKRGLSLQSLHAIGFATGIEGLQALGAVLLAAGVVILGASVAGVVNRSRSIASASFVAAAVALVASPQIRGLAAYINTHVLVAVLIMALVILVTLGRGMLPATTVVAAGLVLSRAEGALLVALVLLGTLALADRRTVRIGPWVTSGIATLVWAGLLGLGAAQVGRGTPTAVVLIGLIGVGLLLVGPGVKSLPRETLVRLPIAVSVLLWGAALLLMLRDDEVVFLDVARENLGGGAGRWGVLGILLVAAAVLAVGLSGGSSSPEATVGRWVLIGYVPLALLTKLGDGLDGDAGLATLLVGGGRTGFGDSVNRMWMHAVLVALLVLLHAAFAAPTARRRSWSRAPGVVVAILAVGWVASQWQPAHLPRVVVSDLNVLRAGGIESAIPTEELVDGSTVTQQLLIPPFVAPQGASAAEVCVDVRLVTFGNVPTGSVVLGLVGGGRTAERTLRGERIADFGVEPVCLALDTDGPEPLGPLDDLTLTVRAVGTSPGAAPGLLLAAGVGPRASVRLPGESGADPGATDASVVLEVRLVLEGPGAPLDRAVDTVALLLPWVAMLIGAGLLASRHWGPRATASSDGTRDGTRRSRRDLLAFVARHGDAAAYLDENPDVADSGADPFRHWCDHGAAEGRRLPGIRGTVDGSGPPVAVDPEYALERAFRAFVTEHADVGAYLEANPDVRDAGLEPLGHWLDSGMAQGRQMPGVDVRPHDPGPREGWRALRWRDAPVLIRTHESLPERVVAAIRRQARHEPAILAPGGATIPDLRRIDATRVLDRIGLDLAGLLHGIPARPERVLVTDVVRSGPGSAKDGHLTLVTGPEQATSRRRRDGRSDHDVIVLAEHLRPGVALDATLLARLLHALAPDELVVDRSVVGAEALQRYGRALSSTMRIVTDPGGGP